MPATRRSAALLAALALAPAATATDGPSPTAEYALVFQSQWNATNHPTDFPAAAHFSALVGATHDASVTLWEPGGLASPGLESMAETGAVGTLGAEILPLVAAGSAGALVSGPALFGIDGSVSTDLTVDLAHPRVTVVTMIAPSPDWFVGTQGLALLQDGAWVDELTVELLAWDAGTDAGATFTSPDDDVTPHAPIALLSGDFPFDGDLTPLGTFTFTRTDAPPPWTDLGQGLAGSLPAPVLTGGGALAGGSAIELALTGALPGAPLGFVLGLGALEAPFKGGVLVPAPDLVVLGLATDAAGAFALPATWPAGVAPGLDVVVQLWIEDAGGPVGWSASNGVCATTE